MSTRLTRRNQFDPFEANNTEVFEDLLVHGDATVKGDLRVEGIGIGSFEGAVVKDLVVYDATVKNHLHVEGKVSEEIYEFPNDPTPIVTNGILFKTDNTASITINNYVGGTKGQRITIIFTDNNTEVQSKNNANIFLQGDKDFKAEENDVLELLFDGKKWYETNRSLNG